MADIRITRTATTFEPIELSELKAFLKVDYSNEDALLAMCLTAAREWVERYTSTFWAKGTAVATITGNTDGEVCTFWAGITDVVLDEDAEYTVALWQKAADYAYVQTSGAPETVTFDLNIGTEEVPGTVKLAIMTQAGKMFMNRGETPQPTGDLKAMLLPYRVYLYI